MSRLPAGELAEVSAEPHVADRRSRGDDDSRRVRMPLAGGVIGGVDKLHRLAGERAARALRSGKEPSVGAKAAAVGNVEELEVEAELKLLAWLDVDLARTPIDVRLVEWPRRVGRRRRSLRRRRVACRWVHRTNRRGDRPDSRRGFRSRRF